MSCQCLANELTFQRRNGFRAASRCSRRLALGFNRSSSVLVPDVSERGARLQGRDLPAPGERLLINFVRPACSQLSRGAAEINAASCSIDNFDDRGLRDIRTRGRLGCCDGPRNKRHSRVRSESGHSAFAASSHVSNALPGMARLLHRHRKAVKPSRLLHPRALAPRRFTGAPRI
jgi:hypothetical protein